jgi:hypothetical protein
MNGHGTSRRTALGIVLAFGCTSDLLVVPPPPPPPAPQPLVGTITVGAFVTGRDLDPDGFTVQLDDGPPMPLTSQTSVTFRNVVPDVHIVRLDGVAPNCEVNSPNPWRQAFSFVDGPTASVRFEVLCMTHGTGRLRVYVSRGFDDFAVSIDDGPVLRAGGGSLDVTDVAEGAHSVRLFLDTGECALDTPSTQSSTVTAGRTTFVGFSAYCALVVSVTTTGENRPSGYTAYLEDYDWYCYWCTGKTVSATDTVTFSVLPANAYRLSLRGVPQNCTASPARDSVVVPAGGSGRVSFGVACR